MPPARKLWQCNACKGTYYDRQDDGTRYFHACPPVRNPEFDKAPTGGRADLREFLPHPDARDENVIVERKLDQEERELERSVRMRAEGKGRTELTEE